MGIRSVAVFGMALGPAFWHYYMVMQEISRPFALHPHAIELGRLFYGSGFEIYLVGGSVRDLFLRRDCYDLDFTTNATPDQTARLLKPWADATWEIGRDFGTIGAVKKDAAGSDVQIEITTYRAEKYDSRSRKPRVVFGDNLHGDLSRRDFTINAMALSLDDKKLEDPFGGLSDLAAGVLKTPGRPEESFSDDPLRMMRAARFVSTLAAAPAEGALRAMKDMAERITVVSAERIRDELVKLINGSYPERGVDVLVATGLAGYVLPEVSRLRQLVDEHRRHKNVYQHTLTVLKQVVQLEADGVLRNAGERKSPDFVLRFAALLHDVGKYKTRVFEEDGGVSFRNHDVVGARMARNRMKRLRFDNDSVNAVAELVGLHMRFYGYADAGWTDSAVRRYVNDAGSQLWRLHYLTRADVTTRNKKKAARLAAAYDDLEDRIAALEEKERLDAIRPDLDGRQIMRILGLAPGPHVGRAYRFLLEKRLEEGPHDFEAAQTMLLKWWEEQD